MTQRIAFYNLHGTVKSNEQKKTVFIEIQGAHGTVELHFKDPNELMNFTVLVMEQMAKMFPDHEASKLWNDPNFQ